MKTQIFYNDNYANQALNQHGLAFMQELTNQKSTAAFELKGRNEQNEFVPKLSQNEVGMRGQQKLSRLERME
jgi:hypothetical protein